MSAIAPANRFQKTFGTPSERARTKVQDTLSDDVQAFIEKAPFLILTTSNMFPI